MKKARYDDLIEKYENPIGHAGSLEVDFDLLQVAGEACALTERENST